MGFLFSPICFAIIMWLLENVNIVVSLNSSLPEISHSFDHIIVPKINFSTHYIPSVEQIERVDAVKRDGFPDDFLFGVATSAFQIEGGWNVSDKSESNWDFMVHQWPETIKDGSNADIAANSYFMYKTDISLMKQIGANAYRMSLSWPRILPTGFNNYVSKDGIRYYNDVINGLLANGIEPHITIFHWDLPQTIQVLGGWTNPLIVDWFVDYARVVFAAFGDRVKLWSTINEPSIQCGYDLGGKYVPATHQSGIADYLCGHYSLLAHSRVYRMYNEEFRRVGITLNLQWPVEYGAKGNTDGTERWYQWYSNWFLHPLFTDKGDYPDMMKERIAKYSYIQGFTKSRLPKFSADEIELIKYSSDFLGVNFYAATLIEKWDNYDEYNTVSLYGDIGMKVAAVDKNSPFADPQCTPWAFVSLMQRINKENNIPMFYITESGYSDSGQLYDVGRAQYYHKHLAEVPKLMAQGIDIRGYFAWSLLDNFEWISGYSQRFGIFSINMTDPTRTRIPKISTKVISNVYKTKTVSQSPWYSYVI